MEKINIVKILRYFIKKVWLIIIIAALVFSAGYTYYNMKKEEMYVSNIDILIDTNENYSIQNSNSLILTCSTMINSRVILSKVIDELNLETDYTTLSNQIKVNYTENSKIIKVTVSNPSNEEAIRIVNSVAKYFSQEASNVFEDNNIIILQEAVESTKQNVIGFRSLLKLVIAGVALGMGIVFVIYYFDTTIKDKEDIEKNNIPILGRIGRNNKKNEEDFNIIKTNIKYGIGNKKTILLASPTSKEIKEIIGKRLANSFANDNEKVLLIQWNKEEKSHLTNSNKSDIKIQETDTKNLYLLTKEGLYSENDIKNLIKKIEKDFDRIVIIGTPIIGHSDSLILSTVSEANIIITRFNRTKTKELEDAINSLKFINTNISGIIISE